MDCTKVLKIWKLVTGYNYSNNFIKKYEAYEKNVFIVSIQLQDIIESYSCVTWMSRMNFGTFQDNFLSELLRKSLLEYL